MKQPPGPGDRSRVVAAAIVAGGQGRRLGGPGVNKGALQIGGCSILERQLAVLRPRFSRIFLIVNTPEVAAPDDLVVLRDRVPPGQGPLAGLDAALAALLAHEEAVVCVGGDMPLITPALLELLRDAAPAAQAVVPRPGLHPEPLLARYARSAAAPIAAALAAQTLRTSAVLAALDVHWLDEATLRAVDPELRSLQNVNTPEDLARIDALAWAGADPTQPWR